MEENNLKDTPRAFSLMDSAYARENLWFSHYAFRESSLAALLETRFGACVSLPVMSFQYPRNPFGSITSAPRFNK